MNTTRHKNLKQRERAEIWKAPLMAEEKVVMLALHDFDVFGQPFDSKTIAYRCGLSQRQLREILGELEARRMVYVTTTVGLRWLVRRGKTWLADEVTSL